MSRRSFSNVVNHFVGSTAAKSASSTSSLPCSGRSRESSTVARYYRWSSTPALGDVADGAERHPIVRIDDRASDGASCFSYVTGSVGGHPPPSHYHTSPNFPDSVHDHSSVSACLNVKLRVPSNSNDVGVFCQSASLLSSLARPQVPRDR
jgi:hypothetical protein